MNRLFGQIKQRFSLRKCSFGVASILIGISFLGASPVSAEESVLARSHEVAAVNVTEATEQPVLGTEPSLVVEATEQERSESEAALAPVEEMGGDAGLVNSRPLAEEELFLANTDDEDKALGTGTLADGEPLLTSTDGEKGNGAKTISTRSLSAEEFLLTKTASGADTEQSESVKPSEEAMKRLEQALKKEAASKVTDYWRANSLETIAQEIKRQEELGIEHYVVQWGDTLSTIAAASQQEVQVITELNKITNPNLILTGQTLTGVLRPNATSQAALFELERRRALAGTSTAWAPRTVETIQKEIKRQEELGLEDYLIQWGDTLSALSVASEQPLDNLVALNQISNQELILTGSLLKGILPPKTPVATPKRVVSGYLYDATNKLLEGEQVGLYLNDELVAELTTDYMGYVYTHLDIDKSYELKADHLAIKLSVDKESRPTVLATEGRLELGRTFADEGEDDKFQLNSHVIYVDDSQYTTEHNDGKQAILSKEITAQPGDILIIPPSKIYETSAAIKVIEIVNKDGQAHITYEEPNFFDVFTEFTLKNETINLADAVFIPADGVTVVSEKKSGDSRLRDIEFKLSNGFEKSLAYEGDLSVSGRVAIELGGEAETKSIDIGWDGISVDFKDFDFRVVKKSSALIESKFELLKLEGSGSILKKKSDEPLVFILGRVYAPFPALGGLAGLEFDLAMEFSIEGSLIAQATIENEMNISLNMTDWKPEFKSSKEQSIKFPKIGFAGEAAYGPSLKGSLKGLKVNMVSLNSFIGLGAEGEATLAQQLSGKPVGEGEGELFWNIKAEAVVDILKNAIEKFNLPNETKLEALSKETLFDFRLPIWKFPGDNGGESDKKIEEEDNGSDHVEKKLNFPKLYKETIDTYRQAVLVDDGTADINALSRVRYKTKELDNLYYAFFDVNKDGVKELIFSPSQEGNIFDIYSLRGEEVVKLSKDTLSMLGERMTLSLLENGNLYYRGSGGALSGGATLYELIGATARLHPKHQVEWDFSRFPKETPYRDIKTGQFYQSEEFIELFGLDNFVDLSQLDWQALFESDLRPVGLAEEEAIRDMLKKTLTIAKFDYLKRDIVLPWETGKQTIQLEAYDMSDFVDFYNTYRPEVYEIADVVKEMKAIELPQSLSSLSKDELVVLSETYKSDWLYFSGDRKIVEVVAGGRGGAFPEIIIPPYSEWKKVDDGYEIITSLNMTDVKPYEKVTVKRNRKTYSGGAHRSLFYIDDIEILDKEFRLNRLSALAKEVYLQNQGANTFRPQDLIVLADDINGTIQIRENTPGSPIRHLVATYRINANKQFEVLNVVKGTWSLVSPRKILV